MSSNHKCAVTVTLAAALVFAAAFMPWGQITGAPKLPAGSPFGERGPFGEGGPFGGNLFGGMELTFTVTGWNGNVSLGGMKMPNWLVVLAAGGVAALCWLKSLAVWSAPLVAPMVLAAYGLFHAGFAIFLLSASDEASLGIGSVLTAAAFVVMLVMLVREFEAGKAANSA